MAPKKKSKQDTEPRVRTNKDYKACYTTFALDPDDIDIVTKQPKRKSMFDMVDERLQLDSRGKVVRDLRAIFNCSANPIDLTIAVVKSVWAEEREKTRAERVAKSLRQLDTIHKQAMRIGELKTAESVIATKAKFTGDTSPEVHINVGAASAEEAQRLANEMKALAESAE